MKKFFAFVLFFFAILGYAQTTVTPNISLQLPARGSTNWNIPLVYNFSQIDNIFGGTIQVPALNVKNFSATNLTLPSSAVTSALGFTPLNPANNLSDVSNATAALANLGGIGASSFKGTWSASTTYSLSSLVIYNNVTYISLIANNLNNEPDTSTSAWQVFVQAGAPYPGVTSNGSNGLNGIGTFTAPINDSGGDIYSVKAYGATGNGTTNDCTAITNTIAAMTSGGTLYFPKGIYNVGSACHLTISLPTTVEGSGECNINSSSSSTCASSIVSSDATGILFTFTALRALVSKLGLINTATATAGAAIRTTSTNPEQQVNLRDVSINGFYDGVDEWTGGGWIIDSSSVAAFYNDGFSVQNTNVEDDGDWEIENSFASGQSSYQSNAGIHVMGGNAGLLSNDTIIGTGAASSGLTYNIELTDCYTNANSLTITNTLAQENLNGPAVYINPCSTDGFKYLIISNSLINGAGYPAIETNYTNGVMISGGVIGTSSTTSPVIEASNGSAFTVFPYVPFNNNTTANSYTSMTDVNDYSTMQQFGTLTLNGSNTSATTGQLTLSSPVGTIDFLNSGGYNGYIASGYSYGGMSFQTPRDNEGFGGFEWLSSAGNEEMELNTSSGNLSLVGSVTATGASSFGTVTTSGNLTTAGSMTNNSGALTLNGTSSSAPVIAMNSDLTTQNQSIQLKSAGTTEWTIENTGSSDNFELINANGVVASIANGAPASALTINSSGVVSAPDGLSTSTINASGSITALGLSGGGAGDLLYQSAAGTTSFLAPETSTANYILTSGGGTGALPKWEVQSTTINGVSCELGGNCTLAVSGSVTINSGSTTGTFSVPSAAVDGVCTFSPNNSAAATDFKNNGAYGAVSSGTFTLTLLSNSTGTDIFSVTCE